MNTFILDNKEYKAAPNKGNMCDGCAFDHDIVNKTEEDIRLTKLCNQTPDCDAGDLIFIEVKQDNL